MASNKKKQDEKMLQILRNQAQLAGNKQCFDCLQRGPTYINTTIGTFVCTKCSGMLRGLTPPHRVKSISMASFTPEEVHFIKDRGNDYCRKVWLALYDEAQEQGKRDEQSQLDFMIAKYERKRYYMEPSASNGPAKELSLHPTSKGSHNTSTSSTEAWPPVETSWAPKPNNSVVKNRSWPSHTNHGPSPSVAKPPPVPPVQAPKMNMTATTNMFTPDRPNTFSFPPSDVFGASSPPSQPFFANFDNNPIFNEPPAATFPTSNSFPSALRTTTEDKYAALKALDSMMKMQSEPAPPVLNSSNGNDWGASTLNKSNPFAELSGTSPIPSNGSPFNPFRTQVDTMASSLPSSQSMPFPVSWNASNDLTVGSSKSSGNPFL